MSMNTVTSPMQPVAPPTKKIRATADLNNVDAVRKRRDELNKLKQKQQMRAAPAGPKAGMASNLTQARSHLDGPPGAKPPAPPGGAPAGPPGALSLNRVRHSDIFPNVPKAAARESHIPPPPSHRQQQGKEPVVRRLDQSFEKRRSPAPLLAATDAATAPTGRSKSAPPSRPPPPPGPPPLTKESLDVTPSRSFSERPPPVIPGARHSSEPPVAAAAVKETPPPPVTTPKAASTLFPGGIPMEATSPPMTDIPAGQPIPVATNRNEEKSNRSVTNLSETDSSAPPTMRAAVPTQMMQKPRQDFIRNLHQFADSPKTSEPALAAPTLAPFSDFDASFAPASQNDNSTSSVLRLEKQVAEQEKSKAEALRKVAMLQEELQKVKEQGQPEELSALLQVADSEGPEKALKWARDRVSGTTPKANRVSKVGFFPPLSPGGLTSPRAATRKRVATPHPKRNKSEKGTSDEPGLYSESVAYVPHEYTSEHATFIVRRPYGKASEKELWFQCGCLNSKQYEKAADVKRPETLEIIAKIGADGSTLSLHGKSFIRHVTADEDADWIEFGSMDETGKPLGSITYIDTDANEKDYSLDDVFEGALLARENYCTSVASLAVGLKAKGSSQGQHNGPGPMLPGTGFSAPEIKASTSEVGVDTGDLPQPPGPPASQVLPKEVANGGHEAPPDQKQQQQQTVPPPDIHDDEGGDIISHVFQSFVGVLLWIIKTIFITIPFRIVTFISLSFIAIVVISMVSLQLADDHGAISMGAGFDSMFNNPGIF